MSSHEFSIPSPRQPELNELRYPNDLRPDGAAITMVDNEGSLYLYPTEDHDFDLSRRMRADGLSSGEVYESPEGDTYVRYPSDADIITLPKVMNASFSLPEATQDISHVLRLTSAALTEIKKRYDVVPDIESIDAAAVDKTRGKAEILAPYLSSHVKTVVDVLSGLKEDALNRCRTQDEVITVVTTFDDEITHSRGRQNENA